RAPRRAFGGTAGNTERGVAGRTRPACESPLVCDLPYRIKLLNYTSFEAPPRTAAYAHGGMNEEVYQSRRCTVRARRRTVVERLHGLGQQERHLTRTRHGTQPRPADGGARHDRAAATEGRARHTGR